MRWFSRSSSCSSSSSSSRLKCPISSYHSAYDLQEQARKNPYSFSDTETDRSTRGSWFFGLGKKSRRSRKLHYLSDRDRRSLSRLHDSDDERATRLSRSPTLDRCYIRAFPQPLPLPDSAIGNRHRDGDSSLLPSPKEPFASRGQEARDRTDGNVDAVPSSLNIRRSPGSARQDANVSSTSTTTTPGDNFWNSVHARSAPTSPFTSPTISPKNERNDDFMPYFNYQRSRQNQLWSAPEAQSPEVLARLPPPAYVDMPILVTDNTSPLQSPRGRSPPQCTTRSPSRPSSPIPKLSHNSSTARRESNVHPLPLPPWPGASPSPSAIFPQAGAKTESLPMNSQWQKGKLIGRGTFGSVYVATNRETGALCAMKEAEIFLDDPKSAECIKQLEQEINVLSHLKHPNIVQYYGSEIVDDKFYIYLEYVHPGSINKYVREHCGAITESVVRNFTRHILSGLAYLHSKKTVHRDIKGANLLVDSAGVVKLADFGMAKHLTGNAADLSLKGSPYWMAPELMLAVMQRDNSSDLAFAIDIWSLGCTIIEMFTGKPPWSEYEGAAAMFKVMKDIPPIPETLSSEGKDFLRLCFTRNPAERPTASMLLDHRFLKNFQHQDVSSSTQVYNGTTLMDKSPSPSWLSERRPDHIPFASLQIAKGIGH